MKWMKMLVLSAVVLVGLAACGNDDSGQDEKKDQEATDTQQMSHEEKSGHESMDHSGSGEVPDDLKEAEDPTFAVGSKAMITADHMPGMDGAEATVVGAYDTTAYIVSYEPTDGGERVTDHKWVIHEEIEGHNDQTFEPGEEVTLRADHMPGMDGAKATIESKEATTVYMVDYVPVDGGEEVTNHKWVTESELKAQ
ncbi:YdhK family protein [Bacillus sp. SB49]|uniref:YdhK family protein n=1 Tax=Bacillus sp. SB49 TaxID=1071080 RepID=UPI0003FF56A2|nr:YdhK family protein [Bacillus sp. SB49]QHT47864.1 YdhK family protein [Bacillus sp. SB49]